MDVRDAFYHGIRHQVRRVLTALGPERIEKGLTAFDDGASNWSQCFFARAFAGELSMHISAYGLVPSKPYISTPEWNIMNKLGLPSHVPVRIVWNLFDQFDTWRNTSTQLMDRATFRKFIEDVLDESRPEVVELLRSLNQVNLERPAECPVS